MERNGCSHCQAWQDQDVRQLDPDSLVEINQVRVDPRLPPAERVNQVIHQMKGNPYGYRCGGLLVKTSFRGTVSLEELLADCLSAPETI